MSSVRLEDDLKEKLRHVAVRKGLSVSEVHRRALQEYLDREMAGAKKSRYSDVIGVGEGEPDLSTRSREVFGEILGARHDRHPD